MSFLQLALVERVFAMQLRGDNAADWRIKLELDAHCKSIFNLHI